LKMMAAIAASSGNSGMSSRLDSMINEITGWGVNHGK
jgi:hypothetical protein